MENSGEKGPWIYLLNDNQRLKVIKDMLLN